MFKFFTSSKPASLPAAPDRGPTALVHVYARDARLFLEPSNRTRWQEAGFWVATGRITVLDIGTPDDELGNAVLAALASCRVEVPVPPRDVALDRALIAAMGVRSRRAAMDGTRACIVSREAAGGEVTIEPQRNGGTTGEGRGYTPVPEAGVRLPSACTAGQVGAALRVAFEHATVVT
jgi:hypothetical protein